MVWTMSGQSGQWCPKPVQSGQWWPKSAWSGQYLPLGIVDLANACFGYGRSGQYLSWVADFILGGVIIGSMANNCHFLKLLLKIVISNQFIDFRKSTSTLITNRLERCPKLKNTILETTLYYFKGGLVAKNMNVQPLVLESGLIREYEK